MIKLLIFALLGFLAYTLYTLLRRSLGGGTSSIPPEKTRQGEEMVRDPHCGTYLPKGEALEKIIDGERHYFCSTRCRDAFKAKKP
jgi:YHS domain-containing protein